MRKKTKSKTMMCRHFLAGKCERTDCEFAHDVSAFKPDEQKCFMAGLPGRTSTKKLIAELGRLGYKVINEPVVHSRGFAPKVTLDSVEKCQELINLGKIKICGKNVTVRKYADSHRKGNGRDARSVFIGGLKGDTTGEDVLKVIEELGFDCEEKPVVSKGFCQRLVLKTVDMCKALRLLERITVNGKKANVREYQSTHLSKRREARVGRVKNQRNHQDKKSKNEGRRGEKKSTYKKEYVKKTVNKSFRIKGRKMNNTRYEKKQSA